MNGITISITTYIITAIISIFVAIIIQIMVTVMAKFSKGEEVDEEELMVEQLREAVSDDDSEIAAVIAIAKSR